MLTNRNTIICMEKLSISIFKCGHKEENCYVTYPNVNLVLADSEDVQQLLAKL